MTLGLPSMYASQLVPEDKLGYNDTMEIYRILCSLVFARDNHS